MGGVVGFLDDALGVDPVGGVRFAALSDRAILDFQKRYQFSGVVDSFDDIEGFETAFGDGHTEWIEVTDGASFLGLHREALEGLLQGEGAELFRVPGDARCIDDGFVLGVVGDLIDGQNGVSGMALEASFGVTEIQFS